MISYLPTLKQLQYLVALHEHGHFGKAAKACFVTQSTLSAGIRELETLLGTTLVERTRRVVRFTMLGNQMVEKAHRILRESEELTDIARSASKPMVGELRMSVIPTIAPFLLPKLLPVLRSKYPELQLYLREETTTDACNSLHHGEADCVLLALPYGCGDVEYSELFDDNLFVAFPKDDPGNLPMTVTSEFIDPNKLLMLVDGHCLKDHILSSCNRPDFREKATMLANSLHTLVQLVDNSLGLTLIPEMAIEAGILENTNIVTRPLTAENPSRKIALIWRTNSPRKKEFELLADEIKTAAQ